MLHHERLRPPTSDFPPDEWRLIEKRFHPEFIAQTEAVMALGNGYLGMRGNPDEGGPSVQNGTFINGFYESWPIVYAEEAYGFARTHQTMLNVTDSKIIKLFVDDEPFSLADANITQYERQPEHGVRYPRSRDSLPNAVGRAGADQVPAADFFSTAPCRRDLV
jgi:alpha,alpha-trehalose phosphorylase